VILILVSSFPFPILSFLPSSFPSLSSILPLSLMPSSSLGVVSVRTRFRFDPVFAAKFVSTRSPSARGGGSGGALLHSPITACVLSSVSIRFRFVAVVSAASLISSAWVRTYDSVASLTA
jgi:hypothetical protein